MSYSELLIGCGHSREKHLYPPPHRYQTFQHVTTLDINPSANPDVICDLTTDSINMAFPPARFDELHAYEVLEHIGAQGDYKLFFRQFYDFWRVLKPNGHLCATVPHYLSPWAWGDPGHTRVINRGTLAFLDPDEYKQLGHSTMSDYRDELGPTNFKCIFSEVRQESFRFMLQAIK